MAEGMAHREKRTTERIAIRIPIRVIVSSSTCGDFTEDTFTILLNAAGARIRLNHAVASNDIIRIVNLESYHEADFRVVGPVSLPGAEFAEWGVECVEKYRNIWGIKLPPPLTAEGTGGGALLECRACRAQGFWPVTLMEVEVLDSTGAITRDCQACAKTTFWAYADLNRRPREFKSSEPVAPPPDPIEELRKIEKRGIRRVGLKLPVLVRSNKGEEETSQSEDVSKGGVAVPLGMELKIGDIVEVFCPYTPGSSGIPQKAEVRRREKFEFGGRRMYGLHYLR